MSHYTSVKTFNSLFAIPDFHLTGFSGAVVFCMSAAFGNILFSAIALNNALDAV
jgi:hypothetical protein